AADIMKALKESNKTSKRQPGTGGSSEGTGVPDEENDITKENVILEWGSKQESKYSKKDKLDDEEKDDKEESRKGDKEDTDAAKADAKKTEEAKDDFKKAELPPTNSSLSISLDAEIRSLLDITIQSKVPHIQSPSILRVPIYVISEPIVLTPVQETSSAAPLRFAKLEKDVFELKDVDHSAATIATLKSQVPTVVYDYLGSKLAPESSNIKTRTINLEKGSEKSASEILKIKREQADKQRRKSLQSSS
ncbi:hypothetical protein Tco_0943132, partial [Tanacetum coccineum]